MAQKQDEWNGDQVKNRSTKQVFYVFSGKCLHKPLIIGNNILGQIPLSLLQL
jgi:hypothetical protein